MEISKNIHMETLAYFVLAFLIETKHCVPDTEVVQFFSVHKLISLSVAITAWPPIFSVGLRNSPPRMK